MGEGKAWGKQASTLTSERVAYLILTPKLPLLICSGDQHEDEGGIRTKTGGMKAVPIKLSMLEN